MSTNRSLRALAVLVVLPLVLMACVEADEVAIEPLRGPGIDGPAPEASADEGEIPAEVGGASAEGEAPPATAPPGVEQRPFDELELPADEPPPPIEPGPPPAAAPAAPASSPAAPAPGPANPPPPQPTTPAPSGGLSGVAAIDDYCTLFQRYGTVMAAVDTALAAGPSQQIPTTLRLASDVYDRGAALAPAAQAEHLEVAQALRDFDTLLAAHGYDMRRLIVAVETDAGVAARMQAIQVDQSLQRINQQVLDSCGISLA